mmetsp:Transcript_74110/g.147329  ORF Transcript_74110/g.147329 Transcript_74110/m.147329 type:complete len:324 (+) Transcript_74110:734-1705(+)
MNLILLRSGSSDGGTAGGSGTETTAAVDTETTASVEDAVDESNPSLLCTAECARPGGSSLSFSSRRRRSACTLSDPSFGRPTIILAAWIAVFISEAAVSYCAALGRVAEAVFPSSLPLSVPLSLPSSLRSSSSSSQLSPSLRSSSSSDEDESSQLSPPSSLSPPSERIKSLAAFVSTYQVLYPLIIPAGNSDSPAAFENSADANAPKPYANRTVCPSWALAQRASASDLLLPVHTNQTLRAASSTGSVSVMRCNGGSESPQWLLPTCYALAAMGGLGTESTYGRLDPCGEGIGRSQVDPRRFPKSGPAALRTPPRQQWAEVRD